MDSISTNVGVLDKSVAILAALADGGPLSLAGLVSATGLSRPTAHRLAAALEAHRLVGRDETGRYRLGLRLLGWAVAVHAELGLVEAARPVLEALRDETGESAQLFVREGDSRLCVAASERPAGLRDTVPVGAVLPIDRGSGGKVLLAFGPEGNGHGGRAIPGPSIWGSWKRSGGGAGRPAWRNGRTACAASALRSSTRGARCTPPSASAGRSTVSVASLGSSWPGRWRRPPGSWNAVPG